jgi:hypothetical protein
MASLARERMVVSVTRLSPLPGAVSGETRYKPVCLFVKIINRCDLRTQMTTRHVAQKEQNTTNRSRQRVMMTGAIDNEG